MNSIGGLSNGLILGGGLVDLKACFVFCKSLGREPDFLLYTELLSSFCKCSVR